MSNELVRYETRPPAVVLTLHRPDRRNALSRGLIAALTEACTRARDDAAARCVILTGAGNAFCAGMDLAELQESVASGVASAPRGVASGVASAPRGGASGVASAPRGVASGVASAPRGESPVWEDAQRLATLYDLIYTLPKPTIAAVNGAAVAGGAGLVSVCDLAVAAPEARFGYPEVRRGLVAAMVMPHLLRHVGERTARYLLLTGELIDAEEACRVGFINAVAPAEQLLPRALAWAHAMAEGGPIALAHTKELLHRFSRQAVSLEEAAQASAAPRLTEECRQGLEAFFNKRPAPWAPGY
jgi:methylglutaconyl-CoA hydratase